MAQPIQEPTQDRAVAGLEFRSRQLFRRPATGTMNVVYAIKLTGDDDGFNPPAIISNGVFSQGLPPELDGWYIVRYWGYQTTPGFLGTDTELAVVLDDVPGGSTNVLTQNIVIPDTGYFPSTFAVIDDAANQIDVFNQLIRYDVRAVDGAFGIGIELTMSPQNTLL